MVDGGRKHQKLGNDGGNGDHIDPAVEYIYKESGKGQLYHNNAHIQMKDPLGVSSGPFDCNVDTVKKIQYNSKKIQDKIGGAFCDKFLRRSCKAQKLGRKGDKDQQNAGSQDSAEGKKSADSPFYQFEISGSVASLTLMLAPTASPPPRAESMRLSWDR